MKKSAVLVAFIVCADFFSSLLADLAVINVFAYSFLLVFCIVFFVCMMTRSIPR